MKTYFNNQTMALLIGVSCSLPMIAQDVIQLPAPNKKFPVTLMQALNDRHSERNFSEKELPQVELSNLLWAANGVNRKDGKRTAPSALNSQSIDLYVCLSNGAYRYDAANHQLVQVSDKDLRDAVAGGQDFVNLAPASIVLVCDMSRYPNGDGRMGLADAGYVSQNICLYCSAAKLACVPRASMDVKKLQKELKLTDKQIPLLNNVVGYGKK